MAVDLFGSDGSRRPNERLSRALEASRTAARMRTARRWSESSLLCVAVIRLFRVTVEMLGRWLDGSVLYTTSAGFVQFIETTLRRWVTNAWGYRWLTAEPDPDVIVIDLRDAKTVVPLLRLLDRVVPAVALISTHSRCVRLWRATLERLRVEPLRIAGGGLLLAVAVLFGDAALASSFTLIRLTVLFGLSIVGVIAFRDRRSWAELRTGRLVGLLAAVFVSPDPPEREVRSGRNTACSDSDEHETDASDSDPSSDR